ncbi:hypothetical protein RFI_39518 [Reticulomyxa filosa]|uniref:Uncharacterized protein n=1 Tax=Reticulomyxa filosa TaxID=46433 RepID=X6LBA2_RETFI|nr:hypothetical protein RFI_39518 [Reticulomyxa filosa]|eukprot:ETN98004.1 hypothetical protein RFI_39518 [Reticulomyxa filosa]
MVVSSAKNENLQFSWERTNTFVSSRQYKCVYNIKEQLYHPSVEFITWKREQCSQINGLTTISLVQIFNKSMISKNESIRIPQQLPINPKKSNKSPHNKIQSINMSPSTSIISSTFYKLAFKSTLYSALTNGEVEVMTTPPSNEIYKRCQQPGMTLFAINCSGYHIDASAGLSCKYYPLSQQIFHYNVSLPNDLHNFNCYVAIVIQSCNVKLFFLFLFLKKNKQIKNCIYHTDRQDMRNDVMALQSDDWTDGDEESNVWLDQRLLVQVVNEDPSPLSNSP